MQKFTIKKYELNNEDSYAVFRNADVEGKISTVINYGEATPIVCGLTLSEAEFLAELYHSRCNEEQ